MKQAFKIKISNNIKNALRISGGTIAGQLIAIVSLPLITRLYGASRMGIWATILSVGMLIQTFCDLGLESSIMVEKDRDYAAKLYTIVTMLGGGISLLMLVIVFPCFLLIQRTTIIDALILSILAVTYGFSLKQVNICYTWLNREKQYSVLMKNPIINYSSMSIIAIGAGLLGYLKYGYYVAMVVSQLLTIVHMRKKLPAFHGMPTALDLKTAVLKYKDLVIYQTPNSLMIQMRDQVPNLLIGSLFGNTVLGYYSVSIKVLNMPINFIAQAIGKIFYQSASELIWQGKSLHNFIHRNLNRAINLGIIPIVGLVAFGDIFAVLFFGNNYLIAGEILRLVAFKTFFSFISVCMLGIEIVLRKQKYALVATISQTVLCSIAICIGAIIGNIYIAIFLLVFFFVMIQLLYYQMLFGTQQISMASHYRKMIFYLVIIIVTVPLLRWLALFVLKCMWSKALSWFNII
ncbi:lipopolysaccharide biosynthesis protein [Lacticaseibacillus paracasei]|uniref:lipopolysaccharide biosynthesis protein n=1 Tax=Lacticaseibacillus paracasei TaxID=1597 RepID=UPI003D79054A